jgi:chemotaxis protein methyltransferase CheR
MPRERDTVQLSSALSRFGLDLNRYTSAHAETFLSRCPDAEAWRSADAEAQLLSTFAIGETSFMRHPEHFAAFRRILPALCESRGGDSLRVWSAGCASGEEAYSLAATLYAAGRVSFDLQAWDLNPEAVARATRGEYRPWSLRGVDARFTQGWLAPSPSGVRVEPWLRKLVRFQVGNLNVDAYPANLDVIFCRNVLLYFRRDAAELVLTRMAESLRPGGVLFLGHYDPRPLAVTGLALDEVDGTQFYRKAALERSARVPELSVIRPIEPVRFAAPRREPLADLEVRIELVRSWVDQGRSAQALAELADIRAAAPLRPDLHVLTALAAEEQGDMRLMLDAARKACFLLPEQPGPNYFLSVAFVRNGELGRASVHRRVAQAAHKHASNAAEVVAYSEGMTVGQLRRLVGASSR